MLAVFLCFTEPNAVSSESYASFSSAKDSVMGFVSPSISNQLLTEISDIPASQDDTTGIVCPEDISRYTDLNSCVAVVSNGLDISDPNGIISTLSWEMTGATEAASNGSGINQIGSYTFNQGITVITYSGATLYNNSINCTFTVTVEDNQAPRLISSPGHITVRNLPGECYANVSWTEPSAADNCVPQDQLIYNSNYSSGQQFPVGSTLVEYRISDGVNTAVHNFTVTVTDAEAPELIAPPDSESECGQSVPDAFTTWAQFERAGGSANDNCSVNYGSFRYVGQTSSGITCPYTVTRTYSISDNDGNVAEVKHVIEVTGEGMAYEATVESTEPEVLLEPGAETQAEILFSKTDVSCKGSRTGMVDLTVNGTSGIVSFVWSTQNGSGIVQGAEDQTTLSDGDYTVMVYEDGVRLLAFDFSILVSDNQAPVLNAPATIQRKCGQSIPAAYSTWTEFANAGGTVHDNCQIYYSTFRLASETQSNPSCPYTITRVYEITDVNGNRGIAEHLIRVGAEEVYLKSGQGTAAVITSTAAGGDWNLGSSWVGGVVPLPTDDVEIVSGATITLTDNRTVVNVTNNGTLLIGSNNLQIDGNLINNGTLTVGSGTITNYGNWTNNGAFTAGTGTVEFTGSTDAIISGSSATDFNAFVLDKGSDVTTDLVVQSDITITDLTFSNGVLDVESGTTDIADIVNVNNTIPSKAGIRVSGGTLTTGYYSIINEGLIEVTSGNATFGTGSGNRVHTQVDGAFIVSGGTVEIAGRLENTAGGTLSGYPSGINISGGIITLATAGNNESGTGSLDVTTNGAFNFTGGTVIFENPSTAGAALDLGLVDGTGNGAKTITNGIFQFGNENTPNGSIFHIDSEIKIPNIVTYSGSALFLAMPADGASSVECIDQATVPTPPVVLDNCGYEITPTVPSGYVVTTYDGCEGDVTYTYTYEDCDGSTHDWVYVYTIDDVTNPTASNPAPITVQCAADVPAPDITVVTDEADNCTAAPEVAFVSDSDNGLTCPKTITRTYSVTDDCGNSINVEQTITINDDTNPTASNPAPITVQCAADVPAPDITVVTDEADNCTAAPEVAFVSDSDNGLTCPKTITRTYSVTDDCGNSINVDQTITINDDTNPTASNPAPVTVQCIGDVPAVDINVVTDEADNCTAAPVVAHVGDVSNGSCPEIITRTYSVTDDCGNSINVDQTITINDDTNPTASNPAPVTVQCIGDVPAVDINVVTDEADNCTAAPVVAHVGDVSNGSCPEIITRTYSVTDDCGNSINVDQTITINDDTNPTASNPAPVTVQCIGDVPAVDINVVTDEADNCTAAPVVAHVGDVSNGSCPEIITRTYSVTDDCGNSITVDQTITINDDTNPTASNPAPVTVQCIGDVPAVDINVVTDEADNCTAAPVVAHVGDVSNGSCPEIITRTYSVTDDCGNSITVDQTITINDDTNPTASNPAPVTVQCIGDVPAVDINVVTDEADNCTAAPVVAHVGDVSNGSCPEIITRTYSVTDDCGNSITVDQTITINDDTNPTASNPAPVTVQCIGDVPAVDINVVTDEADNCTAAPVVAHVGDVSNGSCPEIITRTYSVTDDCGNSITVDQTITINDDTNPTASNPAPVTVQCIGDVPAVDINVVTDEADNCTAAPVVAHVGDVSNGSCPEIITRTYSVTDDCGNSITVDQTITINDDTNPTASNPAPVTVQCIGDVPAVDINVVTDEADNCTAAPVVAHVGDVSNGSCPEIITRTYSVTDDCGNSITVDQTITINDDTNPTASNPAPVTVQCIGDVPAVDINVVTDEADNCTAAPVVAHVGDVSNGSCPEIITRTYSVTDDCGNSITVDQTITINDDTNPTASNPAPVTVQCIGDVPAVDINVVTDEADNCTAAPVVAHVGDVSNGSCPEIITRTYSVTDDCGNSITVDQTITINDDTNPTASNPAPVTVQCIGDVPAVDINVVTDEADNCTAAPVVAHVGDVSNGSCPEIITRTYSVTDDCGNSITVDQTITINDDTNPTASNPAPVTVQCIGDVPAVDINVVTDEADNCTAAPVVAHVGDVSNGSCPEIITRTYSVTDDCGNSITVDQTITINDDTNPTASNPAPVTVQCIGDVPAVDINVVTDEADNCTAAPVVAHVGDVSNGSCPEIITRTYSVTDDCGNSITVDQTITINDDTNPTASNPAPVTVQCIGDVPAVDINVVTDEADNCTAAPVVAHVGDVSNGSCPEIITRTYSVTDDCGNSITVDQTITINDDTNPTASNPAPVTVQCIGDVPAVDINVVTDEADNCTAAPVVAHVGDVSNGSCPEIITRTYSVTDDCGNSINVDQTITINDDTNPTASNPAPVTVQCIGDVPAVDINVVTDEADNCTAAPVVTHVGDVSNGSCPEIITRTYSVTDDCGNSITVDQTITINDDTNPTASNPAPVTVQCIGDVPAVDINVVTDEADNCTAAPVVTHVGDVSNGSCPEIITRTYSVTDDCGNSITVDQTITINDDTNPTASNPAPVTVQCIGDVPAVDINVVTDEADNCTAAPVVAWVSDVSDGGFNPEIITRTYSVTDDCGNSINVEQTITIDDVTPPTALCQPLTIQLDATGNATITPDQIDNGSNDNCTVAGDLVFALNKTDFDCTNVGDNTVTLTVTDEAGNTSTCTATVMVEDNVDPVAICQDITVQLDATGNATITAANIDNGSSDNCAITSRTLSQNNFDCDDVGENTVTLTITDVNGNSSTCDAKVTVEQTILPTALCKDIIVELDASGNATITAGDIDNGSSVVCGTPTLSIDQSTFDCNDVGTQTVILTVSDQNGNSSQCTATVTVQDNILPIVVCQDIIVALDASGAATIAAADIDNGSSDNCSIASLVLDKTSFDCSEVGDHTVTLTVTDEHGNSNSCTANVEIIDNINPIAICRDLTIQLNSSGTAVIAAADINDGSSDNCSIASVTINQTIFDCTHIGTNTVTLTVTDASGNSSTCDGTVTVEDNTNPIAICKNYTVQLDATGNASITAADIDNGSNDACGIASLDLDRYDFTCADLGTNNVTLTVTDNNGNQSSCPAVVTVIDNLPPTASAGGSATICIDETHTLSGATANNGTIEWTHNGQGSLSDETTLTPSYTSVLADAGQTVTLTLTVTGNNACGTNTASAIYTIEVNAVATVNPVDPMEYCAGETTTAVTLGSNLAGATFNISGGQNVGLFNQNGVDEIPSFTAIANTATITITPVYNGCPGDPIDVEITVKPRPSVSAAPLFQTICSGEATDIALGSNITGATMSWTTTVEPAGSNITGMTAGVDESTASINDVLVNNETTEVTVTYHIRAKANGCEGPELNIVVKIKPAFSASIAGTTTVCQEDPAPNITFEVTGGTAPYILTYNINGGSDIDVQLNSGTSINIPAPTDADGDFVYTLVSVYEAGGCTHTFNETATVTVSPKPYLSSTLTPTGVCSNNAFTYTPTSDTPGTTFTWSRAAIAGIDNPAETGTDAIDEFLINTTNAPIPVVYTYTLEAAGCTNSQDVVVMVTPTPSLTSTLSPDGVCSENPFSYTPTSDVSETTFPWTRAAVAGISNPAASGTGDINEVLINTTDNPVAVTYEYTLTSNDCVNQATYSVVVVVTPAPEVTASADVSCVCPGGTVNLTSSSDISGGTPLPGTLLAEDFNGSASGWTTTNTSTGGDPSHAAWTLRPEGYTYDAGYWFWFWWVSQNYTFSSNDDSQFFLSNSHDQDGGTTRTTLESPAFSTVGYNSLELDFYHYYNDNGGDNANIEVSTDGANWTEIQRYDSDRGSSTNFRNETVDLTAYIGQPTLYIRFRYYATEDYFWAIDNVTVTGTSSGTTADVSWEAFNQDFTSSSGEFSTTANPTTTISEPTQFVATYIDPDTNCPGRDTVFVDICETPDPVIAPDYCAVAPNVLLTAYGGAAGATYDWRDSEGDQVGTDQQYIVSLVDRYQVTITNPNGCSATAQLEVSNEMVTNGDFEAGDTGFITDYLPSNNLSTGGQGGSTGGEGLYAIGDDANDYHSNFWGDSDHTSGSGNYMIINGKGSQYVVWENAVDITLLPGTNYYFSGWAMSLNSVGNDAQLVYEIEYDGIVEQIGSTAIIQPGVQNDNNTWLSSGRFYGNWTYTGTSITTARIRVVNLRPDDPGNDFGIDDLSFGTFDPFPLVIDVDFDEVCEGDTLFLYSNSQYGKEPITYSWTGPNGFTSTEQNPIIPNFSIADAGKYKLEAQDAYGCDILPDSTVVPFNEAPVANAGPDDFVCTANPEVNLNGTIDGSATSGYWTGGGGTFNPDANTLNATYTLSQAEIDAGIAELILSTDDPTGVCEAHKDTLYITIHNSLEITTSSTMPDCHGGANGTATATVSVTTVEPYTYLWSDGQTTPTARDLAAGTYSVTVTDANGCTAQATVTVDEPDLFVISAISPIISAPSCYGATDGSATMEVTGGTPPYSFIWDAATGDQRTATASNLAAGTYTVLVTDANGCSAATFTATIPNPPPPSLQCPDDMEDIIDDAACTIVLDDIEEPVFDGYCTTTLSYELSGATTGSGTGSVNGQVNFNVGITTVTYRIEDTAGNQDECSFTVWVKHQNLLPTRYDCPDPIVNAGTPDNYECLKNVTLGQVTLDDQCNEIESIWHDSPYSSDPADASGDYPVGSTSFQWFIRDVSGNIETCDVTVIVDDLDPQITCPADVIETVAANECSKTGVTIDPPDYDDNCPDPVLSYVLTGATTGSGTGEVPSYQVFNIGVTTVTYTVTDAHNNTAQCSFNVTIERLSIPPAVITCPPNPAKVTAVGGTCFAPVSPAAPTVVDPCATTTYTIVNDFNNSDDASDSYPVGTTIVTWTISDNSGKTYECTQTVVVEDIDPTITCPTSVAETIAADQCSKTGVTINPPTFSDNCPNPVLTYTLSGATTGSGINVVPASQVFNIGVTTVTYTVTDTDNRTAECSFTVTIERLSIPPAVINCPVDPPSVTAVAGTCFAPVNPDAPVISDPCATASYTIVNDFTGTDDASGSYPVGTTTVTWTITDNSGKIYTCEQEVVVEDLDPVISCPSDVSEIIAADACSKSDVVLGTPTYSDNCPNPVLTYELSGATTGSGSGTVPANQVFNIGETTVTYTVTDTDNRSASCSYTVTIVRFSIPPAAINCPPDPTPVTAVAGTCFAPVSPAPPTINDPCATTTYTIVNDFTGTDDASDSYPVGTTTVIWTITDNSGKIYTCNQEVIVEDIPPSINCPADYTFLADENVNYKDNVTLADPTYEDNCPNPILEWTRVEPDGTTTHSASTGINFIANPGRYYIGVTTITYKITDSSGLTDECSFTVTVTGIPEIDCPDDILQPTDAGVCTRALDPGVPVLEPGSPTVDNWTWEMTGATTGSGSNAGNTPNPISPNPYTFNVGVTTITWTACNISGCATCEQIIIITDEEPPVITADPYENCVDPLHWAVYNESDPTPQFGHVDPNLEKSPIDYRTLLAGDTDLDLTSLTDNCCDSLSMINNLQWRIEFADTPDPITGAAVSHPNITGEGQPSEYIDPVSGVAADIYLWGDGVTFSTVTHSIFYWIEDCNGNPITEELRKDITITPRPQVIKTDY